MEIAHSSLEKTLGKLDVWFRKKRRKVEDSLTIVKFVD